MIPKISAPLAKSIRTGEGILVYASSTLLIVLGAIPQGLTWQRSTLYLTILNGLNLIARSALKMTAINNAVGIHEGPIDISPKVDPYVGVVEKEILAVEAAIQNLQAQPGTPAAQVTQGLSPSEVKP